MFSRTAPGGEGGEERIRRGTKKQGERGEGKGEGEGGSKEGKRLVKGGIGKRGKGR